ncbi:MAG: hypothetical protein OHK0039_01060 [Bacteroidia bacterium]
MTQRLVAPGFWVGLWLLMVACTAQPATTPGAGQAGAQPDTLLYRRLHDLLRDSSLLAHVTIGTDGIRLYASAADRAAGRVECQIFPGEYAQTHDLLAALPPDSATAWYLRKSSRPWQALPDLPAGASPVAFAPQPGADLPLRGLRVAIDPGHVSNNLAAAEIEGKYVKLLPTEATGWESLQFYEAKLAIATAWLLRDSLEALGAEVLLTRGHDGRGALGGSFDAWRQGGDLDSLLAASQADGSMTAREAAAWRRASLKQQFLSLYNPLDLQARARKIAAFAPHLTLIIHYNIHSPNWEKRDAAGYYPPTDANYCMAFVPGCFVAGELDQPADRAALLRLLLGQDLAASVRVAGDFVRHSENLTGVRPVSATDSLPYLRDYACAMPPPGVYARNLTLTRLVPGPLCYGESLCQDNLREALALSKADTTVHGLAVSRRIFDVAQAYVATVRSFAEQPPADPRQ